MSHKQSTHQKRVKRESSGSRQQEHLKNAILSYIRLKIIALKIITQVIIKRFLTIWWGDGTINLIYDCSGYNRLRF